MDCQKRPHSFFFFFLIIRRPPRSPLFPYTTPFRSRANARQARRPRSAQKAEQHRLGLIGARMTGGDAFHRFGFDRLAVKDRKSTRLNSSHLVISYAVFCLKKKKKRVY